MGGLPSIDGDPAGMRALAAALRGTAETVAGIDSAVYGKTSAMCFVGPAAVRLQSTIFEWHRDVSATAQALQATADLLDRSASAVEEELAARARLEQRQHLEGARR